MKTLLLMLTLVVILVCLTIRTNAFNPIVMADQMAGFAKPDLRGWPEFAILFLIILVMGCLCISPFFTPNEPPFQAGENEKMP